MEYPKRIQRLLNKESRTIEEDDYLRWYGAIGIGAVAKGLIKEYNEKRDKEYDHVRNNN